MATVSQPMSEAPCRAQMGLVGSWAYGWRKSKGARAHSAQVSPATEVSQAVAVSLVCAPGSFPANGCVMTTTAQGRDFIPPRPRRKPCLRR